MKPLEEWDEDYLSTLPIDEDHRFDRKSSVDLIDLASSSHGRKRKSVSKDLSAFANSRGGYLIYGISDDGKIDGGVPLDLKSGTIEWLHAYLPGLIEPQPETLQIKRIEGRLDPPSSIKTGHAVIVVQVPDSERAPHQACDFCYYIRMGDQSKPAEHWQIEDIRSRVTKRSSLALECRGREFTTSKFSASVDIVNTGDMAANSFHWELWIPHRFIERSQPKLFYIDHLSVRRDIHPEQRVLDEMSGWYFSGVADKTVFPRRPLPFVSIVTGPP
jgi:hypothetical protein